MEASKSATDVFVSMETAIRSERAKAVFTPAVREKAQAAVKETFARRENLFKQSSLLTRYLEVTGKLSGYTYDEEIASDALMYVATHADEFVAWMRAGKPQGSSK
jgi:hypothetical protein